METKDTLSSCSYSDEQDMQQMLKQAKILKGGCLNGLSTLKSNFTRILEQGITKSEFERAFSHIFGEDVDTFTRTFSQNMDTLEQQLTKETILESNCQNAFRVLKTQFEKIFTFVLIKPSSLDADTSVLLQQELDLLFGPLYDEFFTAGTSSVNNVTPPKLGRSGKGLLAVCRNPFASTTIGDRESYPYFRELTPNPSHDEPLNQFAVEDKLRDLNAKGIRGIIEDSPSMTPKVLANDPRELLKPIKAIAYAVKMSYRVIKGVELREEEAPYWTTLGKRESYKPRPSSDGIGAKPPYYARKDFLDCHLPENGKFLEMPSLILLRIP
ncbi:hypothetical protein Tco_1236439 [Tanacetum coccineum]